MKNAKDQTQHEPDPTEAGGFEKGSGEGRQIPKVEKVESPTRERAKTEPPKVRKGRRKVKEAATAWAKRNREYLDRRSETIEFAAQALAIWSAENEEVRAERREGKLRGVGKPKGLVRRAPMVGDSIERQVYAKVEHDRLLLKPGGSIEAAIERWPLPFTFYDPVPPLCPADIRDLARQEMDEEARRRREEARVSKGDGRLLPGMGLQA